MLRTYRMTLILPVANMERARRFYRDVLGLADAGRSVDGKYLFATADGGLLALMEKPNADSSDQIRVSFEVDSAEATVRALTDRGVTFEEYDLRGLRMVEKVYDFGVEKAAWFRDPDGNMLCIHQTVFPPRPVAVMGTLERRGTDAVTPAS